MQSTALPRATSGTIASDGNRVTYFYYAACMAWIERESIGRAANLNNPVTPQVMFNLALLAGVAGLAGQSVYRGGGLKFTKFTKSAHPGFCKLCKLCKLCKDSMKNIGFAKENQCFYEKHRFC